MNPAIEEALSGITRGHLFARKVSFWNFLPPDELNALLTLYTKVTQKTLLISKTLGIGGKKLFTPRMISRHSRSSTTPMRHEDGRRGNAP